jgi:predicted ATPase
MADTFRLLRAGGGSASARSVSSDASLPLVVFSDPAGQIDERCFYSILIGNNGSGKSRLLGSIASEFARLKRGSAGRERGPRLDCLEYVAGEVRILRDGVSEGEFASSDAALPTRVIAVALTPIDKFPLEPSGDGDEISTGEIAQLRDDISFYHYVGMRDRTNRASISALLYRALEGLGRERSAAEAARLKSVFEMLGYRPQINAKLRASLGGDVQAFLQNRRDLGDPRPDDTRVLTRLRKLVETGAYSEDWLRRNIAAIGRTSAKQSLELDLHFGDDRPSGAFNGDALRLLRRLGALTLSSVHVSRADGTRHDLRDASSGEISILTVFLSIAAHLRDGSLVLIDEPETSLHPDWQSKYVHLMREVFSGYLGCHFVFSTHSPFIVADLPEGSWVYSMDRASSVSSGELLGRSPDYVMARAFDVISPTNYYLRDVLANALRLVGERQIRSPEFAVELSELVRLADNLDGGEQVKQIVKDLQVAKEELAPDGD